MTKLTSLALGALIFSFNAAATIDTSDFEGIYKVEACDFESIEGYEKARIVSRDDKLAIFGFKAESSNRHSSTDLNLTNGETVDGRTTGVKSWEAKTGPNFIEFVENFDRKGDSTYPDLKTEVTIRLELSANAGLEQQLTITSNSKSVHAGRRSEKSETCQLVSLSTDKNQVLPKALKKLSLSKLEALAAGQSQLKDLDLDQASVHTSRAVLNTKKPSMVALQEALQLELLPSAADSIEVESVKLTQANASKVARSALTTALEIANDYIKDGNQTQEDYKALFSYVKKVEETLKTLPAGVKVYLIKWTNSDQADGEGLLLLDTKTGETLYIGSAYFG